LSNPDIAYAPDDTMAANPLPPSDLPENDRAICPYCDDAQRGNWGMAAVGVAIEATPLDEVPGFTKFERQYIDDALSGKLDDLVDSVSCHGATMCSRTEIGGISMEEVNGRLNGFSEFELQGQLGGGIQPGDLQPGDVLTYQGSERFGVGGTVTHSSRVLETGNNPLLFDKPGNTPFTTRRLDEVKDFWQPESIKVYRRPGLPE
jgi:hypothetical protein